MTLQQILDKLQKVKRNGKNGYLACCPAHDDNNPSLSVTEKGGKILMKCFANCSIGEICSALDIQEKDLFFQSSESDSVLSNIVKKLKKQKPETISIQEVCAYDYVNESGEVVYQNVRYLETFADGSTDKTFKQRHPTADGKFVFGLNGQRRVPYRLPELLIDKKTPVYLCEGEKDVDAIRALDLTATSLKNWLPEFNNFIVGRNVFLLRDHDAPGVKLANDTAAIVQDSANFLKVIDLFDDEPLPEKHGKDVSDWLQAGHTKDELLQLVRASPIWTPTDVPFQTIEDDASIEDIEWLSNPKPLDLTLKPVDALDDGCLPEILVNWLRPASKVIGCPFDFLVLSAIVTTGSLIGSRLRIMPQPHSDWFVVPNIYAGIVGLPSTKKTPALDETRKPILELQCESRKAFEEKKNDFEIEVKWFEKESSKTLKDSQNKDEFKRKLAELTKPVEPFQRRFEVGDITTPKLVQFLSQNPNGLMLFRDELTAWFKSLDADYDKSARAFYLELSKGAVSTSLDRVDGREISLPSATLSIVGGVQPSKLQRFVTEAYSFDNSDGFLQRFVFAYPDTSKRLEKPAEADSMAYRQGFKAANDFLKDLAQYEFGGKVVGNNGDVFRVIKFSADAQKEVNLWTDEIESEAARLEIEDEAFSAFLYKLPKTFFAICLIFHCLEASGLESLSDEVSLPTTLKSIAYTEILISHAQRVFALGENQIFALAQMLLGKIKKGDLLQGFKAREIARKQWSGLKTPDTIKDVLSLLLDYGYLKAVETSEGRHTTVYFFHPSLEAEVSTDEN